MQTEIKKQTHDSSTVDLMAMFDVAASLLRAITGALSNAYMQLDPTTNDVAEGGTNSNMSVDHTKPWLSAKKSRCKTTCRQGRRGNTENATEAAFTLVINIS